MNISEENIADTNQKKILQRIKVTADRMMPLLASFFILLLILRLYGYFSVATSHAGFFEFIFNSLNFDFFYALTVGLVCFIPIFLIGLINRFVAQLIFVIILTLLLICELAMQQYFFQAMVPLGADFWAYSYDEIQHTVGAAGGISVGIVFLFILLVAAFIGLYIYISKLFEREKIQTGYKKIRLIIVGLAILAPFMLVIVAPIQSDYKTEIEYFQALNKMAFFIDKSLEYKTQDASIASLSAQVADAKAATGVSTTGTSANKGPIYIDPANYPFLKKSNDSDVLGQFFNKGNTKPNIVIILVESLGRAYSGPDAYLTSFTPFLDSLGAHSLYWSNFLSTGGRTFAVLPSTLGSLPFAEKGFLDLGDAMPDHITLASILEKDGYNANFYYGGDSHFDNMSIFMQKNGITIHDIKGFDDSYLKLPDNGSSPSWGYEDRSLFKYYLAHLPNDNTPRLDVLLTVANHSPFIVHNQDYYLNLVEQKLNTMTFTSEHPRDDYEQYKMKYSTIMYTDNSIRYFIDEYAKKPSFKNTIFIITGDHRMPEIPIATMIDRFHVPLIIYSPMLKKGERFKGVSAQFDITPTLLSYLAKNYGLKTPSVVPWVGGLLDIDPDFRCIKSYPLMRNKNQLVDYLDGEYFMAENQLFKLSNNMEIDPIDDPGIANQITAKFDLYKLNNKKACSENKIIPDSIKNNWEYKSK